MGTAVSEHGINMAGSTARRASSAPDGTTYLSTDNGDLSIWNGSKWQPVDGMQETLITSAQLLALNATPQTIVDAPGAGKVNELIGLFVMLDYNSAAYAGIAAGEDLAAKYTDASGDTCASIEATGFLDLTADAYASTPAIECLPVANAAIVLHMLTGEVTTGDSPLRVRAFYRTHTVADLESIT